MRLRYVPGLLAIVLIAGCSDHTSPLSTPTTSEKTESTVAGGLGGVAPAGDLVLTPDGYYDRSCVHEVPNGSHVNGLTRIVTRPDGTTYHLGKCLYPGRRDRNGVRDTSPVDDGWMEWADTVANYATDIAAHWKVPAAPGGSYSGNDLYYSFPGLQDAVYVLQPVIQYGYNSSFGGSYWSAASWHCNSGSDCTHSKPITTVSDSDAIVGEVSSGACVAGQCSWTVTTVDSTKGTRTSMTWTDTIAYYDAVGGAVEVKNLTSCDQYPQTGVFFSGISLQENGQSVTPSWNHTINPNSESPSCNFKVTSTATTVDLYHNPPPPYASLTGPDYGNAYSYVTVDATVGGGTPPYTYSWTIDGSPACAGDTTSCTGELGAGGTTTTFTLTVTDANSKQGSGSWGVYACQGTAPCQGPAKSRSGAP